jgi:hypothetical protein
MSLLYIVWTRESSTADACATRCFCLRRTPASTQRISIQRSIGAEPGALFRAFDGQLSGATLYVVAPRLIVQSWRSSNFLDGDPDSTLILSFAQEDQGGRIDLIHIDVPEQDYQGVTEGWEKYYWTPWKRYLARKGRGGTLDATK